MVEPLILKIKKANEAPIKDEIKKILLFSKKLKNINNIIANPEAKPSKPSIQLNAFMIVTIKRHVIKILRLDEIIKSRILY